MDLEMELWELSVLCSALWINLLESIILHLMVNHIQICHQLSCVLYLHIEAPTEWHTAEGVRIIPVVPSFARQQSSDKRNSRRQFPTNFPLKLAYAISIDKSQGMTLNKAAIEGWVRKTLVCPLLQFQGQSNNRLSISKSNRTASVGVVGLGENVKHS